MPISALPLACLLLPVPLVFACYSEIRFRRIPNWLTLAMMVFGLGAGLLEGDWAGLLDAFIGLAVPHVARLLLGTSNHNSLLPVTMLCGAAVALLCNLICLLPGEWGMIPLNAVTPVLGAPVIVYVIVRQRRIKYFN